MRGQKSVLPRKKNGLQCKDHHSLLLYYLLFNASLFRGRQQRERLARMRRFRQESRHRKELLSRWKQQHEAKASAVKEREHHATVLIQRHTRGLLTRRKLVLKEGAVVSIQAAFRGHRVRARLRSARKKKDLDAAIAAVSSLPLPTPYPPVHYGW